MKQRRKENPPVALLLDYENTLLARKGQLTGLWNQIDWGSFYPSFFKERSGVAIVISNSDFRELERENGKENRKIDKLNNLHILSYASVTLSEKLGVIILGKIEGQNKLSLAEILETLLSYLPNTDWIFSEVETKDTEVYISQGFVHPVMADKTPLGDELTEKNDSGALCMFRKNEILTKEITPEKISKIRDEIIFTMEKGMTCKFVFDVDPRAQKFLEELSSKGGITINGDRTLTQKEVSGGLEIIKSRESRGVIVFTLGLDSDLTSYNEEEGASIAPSLYNFHSHPKKAYINHKVKFGWPSPDDYSAFLASIEDHNTIFHLVASLEGIYIISLGDYWAVNWNKLDVSYDFIVDHYDLREENPSLRDYVVKINRILYKKQPIFLLQFSEWGTKKIFEVPYPRWYGNCFYSKKTLELYQKFYNEK